MGRNSPAVSARISPESASAPPPPWPEPGLCSPSLICTSRTRPPFGSSHSDHLAHPVPVVWFWLRLRLLLGFQLQGRPSPAQGPRRPPGSHPSLPSPPPFAASPAPGCGCRYRCRGRRGGGKDGEGCRLAGSSGRFPTTPAPKGEETGCAAAATLGSQKPSPDAGPGPGGGAQVCGAESEGLARS